MQSRVLLLPKWNFYFKENIRSCSFVTQKFGCSLVLLVKYSWNLITYRLLDEQNMNLPGSQASNNCKFCEKIAFRTLQIPWAKYNLIHTQQIYIKIFILLSPSQGVVKRFGKNKDILAHMLRSYGEFLTYIYRLFEVLAHAYF